MIDKCLSTVTYSVSDNLFSEKKKKKWATLIIWLQNNKFISHMEILLPVPGPLVLFKLRFLKSTCYSPYLSYMFYSFTYLGNTIEAKVYIIYSPWKVIL